MNTTEQIITIAEVCGAKWQDVPPCGGYWFEKITNEEKKRVESMHPKRLLSFFTWDFGSRRCAPLPLPDPKTGDAISVPDYTKDANTRPEMLAVLEKRGLNRHFVNNVCVLAVAPGELSNDDYGWSDKDVWNCLSVSQPLFCKAFLETLNLWTE